MKSPDLQSAVLFTPGRASYVETLPDDLFGIDGSFGSDASLTLRLTEASQRRADTAAARFDPSLHTTALFAGGYPGLAQKWPADHTPPVGHREADLMAVPLTQRLLADGEGQTGVDGLVRRQGESDNSIGDVRLSVERGLLNPNDFGNSNGHGVDLVAGKLHGFRFRAIINKALDLDPTFIRGAQMHDPYGTPATEFMPAEPAPIALAKEYAAIVITRKVLQSVKPGDMESLRDAEDHFSAIARKLQG